MRFIIWLTVFIFLAGWAVSESALGGAIFATLVYGLSMGVRALAVRS
jgi:hypothetical protein